MRVVSGEFGGRRLSTPPGNDTRPTTDKVRQAVFNSLESAGILDGALVADLYAGSGAMGIEAVSRGAARCVFVEKDRTALGVLRENVATLGLERRTDVIAGDAMHAADRLGPVDLVIADPPYAFDSWPELLGRLSAPEVIVESDREIDAPEGWESVRCRRYGRTFITWLHRIA
jgi:16S rRNA (guanine966-N2)-methyltransferase